MRRELPVRQQRLSGRVSGVEPRGLIDFSVEGIARHRVRVSYTNIYLMKIWNCIALGESTGRAELAAHGYAMLDRRLLYTAQYGVPTHRRRVNLPSVTPGYLLRFRFFEPKKSSCPQMTQIDADEVPNPRSSASSAGTFCLSRSFAKWVRRVTSPSSTRRR